MKTLFKLVLSLLLSGLTGFYIQTVLLITTDLSGWECLVLSLSCAVWVGWHSWKLLAGALIHVSVAVLTGALIFGAFAFIFSFFGTMLVMTDSRETAFTGIIIISFLGLLLGAVSGYFYANSQKRN
ncbi:hypothetical protein SAMN05216326_10968 [Nitrosomonas marina]|uniref:TIGR04086 family membrane protein n=1 Tax=Nitrosomonas marina TaxID=917 RepID=A0A1I0B4T6_9PROT|nr:hypothetical protein [Nitrosomonas marina]SET01808.1 hypothetical protein SAMN05216326_10968 [Nitrosomonas marina]